MRTNANEILGLLQVLRPNAKFVGSNIMQDYGLDKEKLIGYQFDLLYLKAHVFEEIRQLCPAVEWEIEHIKGHIKELEAYEDETYPRAYRLLNDFYVLVFKPGVYLITD